MFFNGFPGFSATKSAARAPTQLELAHTSHTAPTPSKKPSRLQTVLRALRLSRSQPKVEEEQHRQPQVSHVASVALQPPCPATHQGTTLSALARPSATSTPISISHSTFLSTDSARLTIPPSATTTPATIHSNLPVASAPKSPLPATDPTAVTKRIADLELTISQLEQDNARQISDTNALFHKKIYPRMTAFAEERDAEDRLAEVVASHAKTEDVILKERERHRKVERARLEAYFAEYRNGHSLGRRSGIYKAASGTRLLPNF